MTIAIAPTLPDLQEGIRNLLPEITAIRHDLHRHPELAFEERRTADLVARYLTGLGYTVTPGVAKTGLVATLVKGSGRRKLALRADMDALPITEQTGLPYQSNRPGVMHACGHDGHTAILLAAARQLAERSHFSGTLHLVFQPAEEIGAGARAMLNDGLVDRFPVDAIYGLHNWPGLEAGRFAFIEGPAMASVDQAIIRFKGQGGHGAEPHTTVDPVVVAAQFITALQSVVARNIDPRDMAVVTIGSIHGGSASNVIPESVELKLTARAFREEVRAQLKERIPALAVAHAKGFGAKAEIAYRLGFPIVDNSERETRFARDVALATFGADAIDLRFQPRTASEDFAYFLAEIPGSYFFVGNGLGAPLHSPHFNFNDNAIEPAAIHWVRLAETFLQPS